MYETLHLPFTHISSTLEEELSPLIQDVHMSKALYHLAQATMYVTEQHLHRIKRDSRFTITYQRDSIQLELLRGKHHYALYLSDLLRSLTYQHDGVLHPEFTVYLDMASHKPELATGFILNTPAWRNNLERSAEHLQELIELLSNSELSADQAYAAIIQNTANSTDLALRYQRTGSNRAVHVSPRAPASA